VGDAADVATGGRGCCLHEGWSREPDQENREDWW
jgi:hypothetical protein